MKIFLRIAGALAVLLGLLAAASLWVAQSDWLRDRIRAEIVGQVETATGGKAELQAFHLDWRTLQARIDRFVIHGSEPAGSAPLLQVDSATVRLRILSLFRHDFQIDHVEVEHPQAHVIVYPDGRTNLPQPRRRSAKSPVGTILDLKIGKFDVRNGTFSVESPGEPPRVTPWEAQGRNLVAQVDYDVAGSRYSGKIAVAPLHVMSLDLELAADAALERNCVVVSHATIKSGDSDLTSRTQCLTTSRIPYSPPDTARGSPYRKPSNVSNFPNSPSNYRESRISRARHGSCPAPITKSMAIFVAQALSQPSKRLPPNSCSAACA